MIEVVRGRKEMEVVSFYGRRLLGVACGLKYIGCEKCLGLPKRDHNLHIHIRKPNFRFSGVKDELQ